MSKDIKQNLIIPGSLFLIIIIVILNVIFTIRFLDFGNLLIQQKLDSNINSLDSYLLHCGEYSRIAAVSTAREQGVVAAVKARDNAELLRIFADKYEHYNVDFFVVTDNYGKVLMRTHVPDGYGDSVADEPNVVEALKGQVTTYYESSEYVRVAVRTGVPIYDDDKELVGTVTTGIRFDTEETVDRLKEILNTEVTVFYGNTRIATTLYVDERRALGTALDPEIAAVVFGEKQEYYGELEIFGNLYQTYYKPFFNSADEIFAIIFLGVPIDDLKNTANTLTANSIFTGIAGILVSIILFYALRKAIRASRSKSSFLATMSHELRTPINAIIGMATVAGTTKDNKKKDYAITKINSASSHLLYIINDILDMSRIEANKLVLDHVAFDFGKCLKNIESIIKFKTNEKHLDFKTEIDPGIPPVIIGDEGRLTQALINLLGNAVKFTPENGSIHLGVRLKKTAGKACTLQFDITDTGIGIKSEEQSRLFKSFEQADSSTVRKFGGTGLGLAISKRIVEMMDGKIWFESEYGKGTTFSFTITALACDNYNEVKIGDENQESYKFGKLDDFRDYRLLIAEDMEINREVLSALLEPTNIRIEYAENGAEAVRMVAESTENKNERYDIVLMDIQMPEMDGYEATRRIRKFNRELPIIALSANVFSEDIAKSLQAGMNAHIGKPIDIDELLRVLKGFLAGNRS
ncbi:MAG: ATP-binding protein [Lachnospiraceae bacterium]|nr:ATP-binding protein [Lachnospiraceae bacterium]